MAFLRLLLAAMLLTLHGGSASEYVTYEPGNLPVIITASHGGNEEPTEVPDRSVDTGVSTSRLYCGHRGDCGGCLYNHTYDAPNGCSDGTCEVKGKYKDSYTKTIAIGLRDAIVSLTGKKPYLVAVELKRNKLDANREINQATFGNTLATSVFNEFFSNIEQAKSAIGGNGMLFDIHGQTHSHGMTELGYTVSKTKLDCGMSCIDADDTSIRSLLSRTCGGDTDCCYESIIRGNRSLGHWLNLKGYGVLPSPINKIIGGNAYAAGAYIANTAGSKHGGVVDAIQLELPRFLRFNREARELLITDLAAAIVEFMTDLYGTQF